MSFWDVGKHSNVHVTALLKATPVFEFLLQRGTSSIGLFPKIIPLKKIKSWKNHNIPSSYADANSTVDFSIVEYWNKEGICNSMEVRH